MQHNSNIEPITRRVFIRQAGGLAVGLALVPLAGCDTNSVTPRMAGADVPFLSSPTVVPSEGGFYVQNGAEAAIGGWQMPDLDPAAWTLRIEGLVNTPLTLRLSDLEAESDNAVTLLKTMRCITDDNEFPGLIGTTLWTGIPLRIFLDRAGIDRANTRRVRVFGSDGFSNNLLLDDIYRDLGDDEFEPMLVTHMDGEPLTREHGRPVRLFVYNSYGYKCIKWITRIEATDSDEEFGTYQEVLGFVDDGVIRVASKITNPVFNQELATGTVLITGFAVSGFGAIDRVEVSIDDAPFEAARIVPLSELMNAEPSLSQAKQVADGLAFPFSSVWVKWDFRWDATPGEHIIRIRATDTADNTQPDRDFVREDGSNPTPTITVNVS